MILSAIAMLILYTFLHELGHCIAAVACGATITEFSINLLNAHMASVGGHFTYWTAMWYNANGLLFPLIISYVHMLFYQKENKNPLYQILSYFGVMISFYSIFPWVLIPIFFLAGIPPEGDDCTKLLQIFSLKYHPIFISIGAVILLIFSLMLVNKKDILTNVLSSIKKHSIKKQHNSTGET